MTETDIDNSTLREPSPSTPGTSVVSAFVPTVASTIAIGTLAAIAVLNEIYPNEVVPPLWVQVPLSLLGLAGGPFVLARVCAFAALTLAWLAIVAKVKRTSIRFITTGIAVAWTLASMRYLAHVYYY